MKKTIILALPLTLLVLGKTIRAVEGPPPPPEIEDPIVFDMTGVDTGKAYRVVGRNRTGHEVEFGYSPGHHIQMQNLGRRPLDETEAVQQPSGGQHESAREGVTHTPCATEAGPWWEGITLAPVPTNDWAWAAQQLQEQDHLVWPLEHHMKYAAAEASLATNLWTMLATVHGDLRGKKLDNLPRVRRNLGIMAYPRFLTNHFAQVRAQYGNLSDEEIYEKHWPQGMIRDEADLQRRRKENKIAQNIRSYESNRWSLEKRTKTAMGNIAPSGALASFPVGERNAIVSNLVALARFTPEEAASLGLTNIVEAVATE